MCKKVGYDCIFIVGVAHSMLYWFVTGKCGQFTDCYNKAPFVVTCVCVYIHLYTCKGLLLGRTP